MILLLFCYCGNSSCFTTEILEGFDVQRTSSLADTLKRYGYLTLAIADYYKSSCEGGCRSTNSCPEYRDFIRKCEDLDKMTVSDVFASQLMQVDVPGAYFMFFELEIDWLGILISFLADAWS